MIVLTQLVYIHEGKADVFEEFEGHALPLITKYGGALLLRMRPDRDSVIASSIEVPYEIHLVRFESEEAFASFAADETRQRFLHLKAEAVRSTWLVHGAPTKM